jgi:hypothetical protein
VILALAVLNGGLRESVLVPALGTRAAYILSGILLSACILIVATGLARWMKLGDARRGLTVGLLWLLLTVAFEFGFGGLVRGRSWSDMLDAYTFRDGNVWPLVLAVTFFAPLLAMLVRGRAPR